jgi:hypothetical protein
MVDDPAVRSLRVAVALCDRFAELLKGPQSVSATKQGRALVGVSGNQDDLSLRIGEVQQLYPEIWRHLDDARAAFAARGVNVSVFDEIRAGEGVALGAAVDVKHTRYGAGPYTADEVVKTANFNRAGYTRAIKASKALMDATPEIDWKAIAKAEADDPNIAAFTRSTTTKRWVMIGLLAAVIAAPFAYVWNERRQEQNKRDARRAAYVEPRTRKLSDADRTAIEKTVAESKQSLDAARQSWAAAMTPDALAAIEPGTGPCEFQFQAPSANAAARFVKYGSVDADYGEPFESYMAADPINPGTLTRAAVTVDGLGRRLASGHATAEDAARVRKLLPTHVPVLVIDKDVEPAAGSGTTFTSGQVLGRAYVFSVARQKIVCAAAIDVKNTPDLTTSPKDGEAQQMLFRDLEVQLRKAIAANLKSL